MDSSDQLKPTPQNDASDASMVRRAQDGDELACSDWINRWRDYLLLIANQSLEPSLQVRVAPSDIVQQSMLDAQQNLAKFKGTTEAEFQTWLKRILKNNITDARRGQLSQKRGGRQRHVDLFDSTIQPTISDPQATPQTHALLDERKRIVEQAMEKLPDTERDVIRRKTWDEQSFASIAKELGRTENEIRRIWYRAIIKLQETMSAMFPEAGREK